MANKVVCSVCGDEIDTRGIRMHMAKHAKDEQIEQNKGKTLVESDKEPVKEVEQKEKEMTPEETLDLIKAEKVKEVEIKPEKDVVEKTKEVKTEDFNSCGECGQTFKGNPNYCPKCGCEFQ